MRRAAFVKNQQKDWSQTALLLDTTRPFALVNGQRTSLRTVLQVKHRPGDPDRTRSQTPQAQTGPGAHSPGPRQGPGTKHRPRDPDRDQGVKHRPRDPDRDQGVKHRPGDPDGPGTETGDQTEGPNRDTNTS
ncbi:hypothetical protein WMY93_033240 [Mugilogobius chulae]|uniref:Uncharacterized protein n=1 Tax=Mugilogobius chulae TaxID=88201 RepID=A0AAW0MNH2_9GOBI